MISFAHIFVMDHLRHATYVMKMVKIVQCRHPVVKVWSMQTLFFMLRHMNPDVLGHSLDLEVIVSVNCSWTGQTELCVNVHTCVHYHAHKCIILSAMVLHSCKY